MLFAASVRADPPAVSSRVIVPWYWSPCLLHLQLARPFGPVADLKSRVDAAIQTRLFELTPARAPASLFSFVKETPDGGFALDRDGRVVARGGSSILGYSGQLRFDPALLRGVGLTLSGTADLKGPSRIEAGPEFTLCSFPIRGSSATLTCYAGFRGLVADTATGPRGGIATTFGLGVSAGGVSARVVGGPSIDVPLLTHVPVPGGATWFVVTRNF